LALFEVDPDLTTAMVDGALKPDVSLSQKLI